jgi:ubiquinone/menaquinone biosynthesis C-methylase UbiE
MKSKFAVSEDIFSAAYTEINKRLLEITREHELINHNEINAERFSEWFGKINEPRTFYGSRFWEYPFAILSADIKTGMQCADIGCGSTPFTPLLCELAGKENVTGFDPDYVQKDEDRHLSFGARKTHIEKFGFNFKPDSFTSLSVADGTFDRVFCISVLEHIEDPVVKQKGLQEMARVLKPGGKLILTFDTGIDLILNPVLKVIELSGLIPSNELDMRWPEKRFVNYGDSCIDVFGLVLEKPGGEIYKDYKQSEKIPAHTAMRKYVKNANWFNVPYNSIMAARDLEQNMGIIKVALKKILKRY